MTQVLTHYPNITDIFGEIVHWPTLSCQAPHKDLSKPDTILTSITYLNDKFMGGETVVHDTLTVTPALGRTIIFNGKINTHHVNTITAGERWTMPIWYKDAAAQDAEI